MKDLNRASSPALSLFMSFILFMTFMAAPQAQGGRGRAEGAAPPTGTGVIIGRVVEAATTSGVAGTVVTLSGAGGAITQRVRVDSSGRFLFRDLPVGEFTVIARKAGYVGGAAGQRSPNGPSRPVELAEGERLKDLTLRLWQAGVIAGTIVDEAGEPVVGIKVALVERRLIDGRRRLAPGQNFVAATDDRGLYRFGAVPPGDYFVVARTAEEEIARGLMSLVMGDPGVIMSLASKAMGGRPQDLVTFESALRVYPPVFHPSALLPSQATAVTITSGEVREGVDIRMKLVPIARLAGTFTGLPTEPSGPLQVRLVLPDADGSEFEVARAIDTSNSQFDFLVVPAGHYILRAYQGPGMTRPVNANGPGQVVVSGRGGGPPPPAVSTNPVYWASMPISLNGLESQSLTVRMERGFTIRGRVEFDGNAPRPEPDQLERMIVTLSAEDPLTPGMNLGAMKVERDGTFRTVSVPPGKYRLRVSPVGVWSPKSAMSEDRDVIDEALGVETSDVGNVVITLTDRRLGSVSGTVRTAKGEPDPDALVAIFPADPKLRTDLSGSGRRLRLARTTKAGQYAIPGLPAGEYLIVAGGDELFDTWLEAAALQALAQRSTPIEIGDGTARSQELRRSAR